MSLASKKGKDSQRVPDASQQTEDSAQESAQQTEEDTAMPERRIKILDGASDTAASFEFENEDHTLGNALRWIITKNPDVEFCGYTIPHPAEPKMNVRIQTWEGTTVYEALEKGLEDLMDLCDVVATKFTIARDEFNANRMDEAEG